MAKRNSWFRQNFMGADAFHKGVKPITLAVYSKDITPQQLREVASRVMPPGFVGTSPQIVKTLDGEYAISSAGTAQFFPFGRAPEDAFLI